MKKLLLLLSLLTPIFAAAQTNNPLPIDSVSKIVSYSEVIRVDSVSKDDLYTRAREWFAVNFRSAQNVIQMDDKAAGKIIGKANSTGEIYLAPLVYTGFTERFIVSIIVKDGRYRYEISDFTVQNDPYRGMVSPETPLESYVLNPKYINDNGEYKKTIKGYVQCTQKAGESLASTLKIAMANKPKGVKSKEDF